MAANGVGADLIRTNLAEADDRAIEGIVSRGRRASLALGRQNGDKEGGTIDSKSVTLEERRADVDKALAWLKKEMLAMRRQDQELIKQLMSIRSTIQKLKRRQQEDWVSVSDSSESEDDCYGTPGSVPPSVLTPCTDRKRKLSSGGMNRLSAITRTRRPVPSSNGTTLALTDASGIRHSPPVHLKQYMKPKESSEDGRRHHRKGLETVNGRTD